MAVAAGLPRAKRYKTKAGSLYSLVILVFLIAGRSWFVDGSSIYTAHAEVNHQRRQGPASSGGPRCYLPWQRSPAPHLPVLCALERAPLSMGVREGFRLGYTVPCRNVASAEFWLNLLTAKKQFAKTLLAGMSSNKNMFCYKCSPQGRV